MQITVTLADKLIKTAITNTLDGEIYEYFNSAVLKRAKLPKQSALTNKIFADPKFQATLEKKLADAAYNEIEDLIFDLMYEVKLPEVDALIKQCQDTMEKLNDEVEAEQEAEEVKRMVKTLERAGFKIVKA
jgi:dephospho-CoA kinase